MRFKCGLFFLFFLFSILKSNAQDNFNTWYQYLMSAKLEKKNLTALSQYRAYDLALDSRLFLVSAYLDFEVSKRVKPALGLMYLHLTPYKANGDKKVRNEIRPFQQVTLDTYIGKFSLSHRFRIEERFVTNPDVFILRLRYLLSMRIPFNKEGQKEFLYGILKNEIRLNAINDDFFDSDRVTAGLGFKVSKKFAVELAYVNQFESKGSSHYAYIGFRNSFDWRKKK